MTQRAVLHRAVLAVRSDAPRCDAMQQEYFYPGSGGASCEKPIIINMPLPEKALSREFRNLLKDQVRPLVGCPDCLRSEASNPKAKAEPSWPVARKLAVASPVLALQAAPT